MLSVQKPTQVIAPMAQNHSINEKLTNVAGSLEARREKKAAVTSFARERDERHVAF